MLPNARPAKCTTRAQGRASVAALENGRPDLTGGAPIRRRASRRRNKALLFNISLEVRPAQSKPAEILRDKTRSLKPAGVLRKLIDGSFK